MLLLFKELVISENEQNNKSTKCFRNENNLLFYFCLQLVKCNRYFQTLFG